MQKNNVDVCLIGYEEGENLGLRYIAAFLEKNGVKVALEPYDPGTKAELLQQIRETRPRIVGFSLIFQRMLPDFTELISYLREHGVTAHFTIGGHFPTVEYAAALAAVPGLDSVVRGEGELTLLELFQKIDRPDSWPGIKGLAFRLNGNILGNPPRPLIPDLDILPFPKRNHETQRQRGLGMSTLLASRGCYYNCTFCSIRQFYGESPGPIRRSRSPGNVVSEMTELFHSKGSRIFIFEDDDFLTRNRVQRRWIKEFTREVKAAGIADQIVFRVSCRVDDVEEELVADLMDIGLMCLYLGIESGNPEGLKVYNKHYTLEDIHKTLDILIKLGIPYEFGFMILNPYATIDTVKQDIAFLKEINEHKQAVFQFTRTMPYSGTPIARRLKAEGRLLGTIDNPDYSYTDPRVDWLQVFFTQAFHERNFGHHGLVELLRFAKFDALLTRKFLADRWDGAAYFQELRELIYRGNAVCLEKMSLAANFMGRLSQDQILEYWSFLEGLISEEKREEQAIRQSLFSSMSRYGFSIGI